VVFSARTLCSHWLIGLGEALSSICAMGTLQITTCHASCVPNGTKLVFDGHGKLAQRLPIARERGTRKQLMKRIDE
jgi:hypothetical protein